MGLEKNMRTVNFADLGKLSLAKTLEVQQIIKSLRSEQKIEDTIVFVEHTPVVYFGSAKKYNAFSPEFVKKIESEFGSFSESFAKKHLRKIDVGFLENRRGGGGTYLGPGQLTTYLILDCEELTGSKTGVGTYKNMLDKIMLNTINSYGINALSVNVAKKIGDLDNDSARSDRKDIWVVKNRKNYKIAAKGINLSQGITFNGFSIFVKKEGLKGFEYVLACGYPKELLDVTCIEAETGKNIEMEELKTRLKSGIKSILNYDKTENVDIKNILRTY